MPSTTIVDGCQLEVDKDRGIIYVHSPQGVTLLRICSIPSELIHLEWDSRDKVYMGLTDLRGPGRLVWH